MYYAEPRRTWLQKQGYYFVWLNRMADTYFVSKLQVHDWRSIIHLSVSSNIHCGLIVWIHFTNTKSFFKIQKQFDHFRGQISDWNRSNITLTAKSLKHMSHFAYACKTKGKNGISHLISALCVNCLISILEYSRIIDYSIIWMCIWCGLLQKLYKIKKSELLNSKVYSKV